MSISYFSFAQGVSISITDAETGYIDIETLTGTQNNPHQSCCEPMTIEVTFSQLPPYSSNLFLEIYYFSLDQEFNFEDCEFCTTGTIGTTNSKIVIDETVPPGIPGNPMSYTMTMEIPYFNTNSGDLYFKYKNDQGTNLVIDERIESNIANCPTVTTKVSQLISEQVWPSSTTACSGAFFSNLRPQVDIIVDVSDYCFLGNPAAGTGRELINFGPGNQLIVEEGNKLTIDYVHFYSCYGEMWKGIYLEKGAELVMKNSIIEDAEFAITFEKGAKLTLEDNEFIDNFVHMKALSVRIVEDTGDETEISSFKNNEFTGSGSLASTYEGQTTNPQHYPYAGILIGDGSAGWRTCGTLRFTTDNVTDRNKFSDLANGILNQRDGGNLYLKGSTFNEINSTTGAGYATSGFGINHETHLRSSIINGFDSWPDGYSFSNVDIALRSNLAAIIKFDKQVVDQCFRGVYSTKTISSSYIHNNTFSTSWNAIEIANSNIRADFEIIDNDINLDIPTTQVLDKGGIVLSNVNCPFSSNSTSNISENSIYADEGEVGIGLFDVENLSVEDNFIGIAEDITDAKGISALGGKNISITCNDFQGAYGILGNNTLTTGIYFSGLNRSTITCSDISKTHTAIQVHLMNETQLQGNALHTNSIGIEYGNDAEPNAQTGPQEYNGNQWLNSYSTGQGEYGALHNAIQLIAEKSQYIVNDNQGSQYTTVDYPDFVNEDDDDLNFTCEDSLIDCTIELGLVLKQWDRLDSVVFTDSLFDEHLLRDLQWKVYRNMKEEILALDGDFNALASYIGVHEMYEADSTLRAILQYMELDTFPDSILNVASVDTLSNTQLKDLYSELAANYEQMQTGLEIYISNEEWAAGTEDPYLNYLSEALYQESLLWSSEEGYLNAFDIEVCSFEGGDAWNRMNALQPSDTISYSLNECVEGRESFILEQDNEFELRISPNPAHYELQVLNVENLPASKLHYTIFDLNGRTVQSGKLTSSGMIRLNAKLQSGLYILKVNHHSAKFNVFR